MLVARDGAPKIPKYTTTVHHFVEDNFDLDPQPYPFDSASGFPRPEEPLSIRKPYNP